LVVPELRSNPPEVVCMPCISLINQFNQAAESNQGLDYKFVNCIRQIACAQRADLAQRRPCCSREI